jgi:hypothetical protein
MLSIALCRPPAADDWEGLAPEGPPCAHHGLHSDGGAFAEPEGAEVCLYCPLLGGRSRISIMTAVWRRPSASCSGRTSMR